MFSLQEHQLCGFFSPDWRSANGILHDRWNPTVDFMVTVVDVVEFLRDTEWTFPVQKCVPGSEIYLADRRQQRYVCVCLLKYFILFQHSSLPPTSPFTTQVYTVGCCRLWCGMLPSLAFMFCSTHNPSELSWEVSMWISISAVKRMLDDEIPGSTMSCQPILLLGNIGGITVYALCNTSDDICISFLSSDRWGEIIFDLPLPLRCGCWYNGLRSHTAGRCG